MLYGPVYDDHRRTLTDAVWHEKFAVITLNVCVAGLVCFPNFFNEIIYDSFAPIIKALGAFLFVVLKNKTKRKWIIHNF